jgi:hypothetical protein
MYGDACRGLRQVCLPDPRGVMRQRSALAQLRRSMEDTATETSRAWLHTTDAVGPEHTFSTKNGWCENKVDEFITHIRRLLPVTVSDFKRAAKENPDLTVEHLCATQCAACVFEFYFDQGEPFYGHVKDRMDNKKSRQTAPGWSLIKHIRESDMRHVPGLQRGKEYFDYKRLKTPILEHMETVKSYRLPRRRPLR